MSIAERIPTTHRGQVLTLTAAAAAWVTVYWVNGWLWDTLLYNGFGMDPDARLTGTVHFFVYDTIKIVLLLVAIIFIVTVLRSYMSIERTRALLGGKREGVGNVMAAGLVRALTSSYVGPVGLEPTTRGLKVRCSAN